MKKFLTKNLFILLFIFSLSWLLICLYVYQTTIARELPIELEKSEEVIDDLRVGLVINNFPKLQVKNGSFIIDASVWFEYEKGAYKPSEFSSFRFHMGKFNYVSLPKVSQLKNKERVAFDFVLNFENKLNFQDFPFDKHRIDLVLLGGPSEKLRQPIFVENTSFVLKKDAIEHGWSPKSGEVRSGIYRPGQDYWQKGYKIEDDFSRPQIVFSILLAKKSPKLFLLLVLPLFLIFLIGLISLTFDLVSGFSAILSLSVGSLTGFLFYRGVIDRIMPLTEQFTTIDRIYFLLLFLATTSLCVQTFFLHRTRWLKKQFDSEQVLNQKIQQINFFRACLFVLFLVALQIVVVPIY